MTSKKKNIDELITDAVFDLMHTKEIPYITVEAVIEHAGIARSSFYRHFSSVDEVIRKTESDFFDEMVLINEIALKSRGNSFSLEQTESMVRRMEIFLVHRDHILLLFGSNGDPLFSHKMTVLMTEYFKKKFSLSKNDPNLDFYIEFVVAGHHALVIYWLSEHPDVSPVKIAAMMNKLIYSVFNGNSG